MSLNPLLLLSSAWAADGATATTPVDINSYCTADVPLGFPTETVAIFLGAFVFSLIVDLLQHKNSKKLPLQVLLSGPYFRFYFHWVFMVGLCTTMVQRVVLSF